MYTISISNRYKLPELIAFQGHPLEGPWCPNWAFPPLLHLSGQYAADSQPQGTCSAHPDFSVENIAILRASQLAETNNWIWMKQLDVAHHVARVVESMDMCGIGIWENPWKSAEKIIQNHWKSSKITENHPKSSKILFSLRAGRMCTFPPVSSD